MFAKVTSPFLIFHFRLAAPVPFKSGHFNMKKISVTAGTPLPATYAFGKGLFSFVVHQDLSVTFNGER
jgi:hypothetical protein